MGQGAPAGRPLIQIFGNEAAPNQSAQHAFNMIASSIPPESTNDGSNPQRRRHRRFPSRNSNKSGDSGDASAAAAAAADAPRLRRLQRLRLSSSLQHKAMMQKRVEAQENDDFAQDMRYSSGTLEGMLLRIPSGPLTGATTATGTSRSSAGYASDGSSPARRGNILQMAKKKVTPPRRSQQQQKTVIAPPSPAPLHRVDSAVSAVSSLGCSKFTDTDSPNHIDEHGIDDTEDHMLSTSKADDDAIDPGDIPRIAVASSFEQIREDIDSFEREAAEAVSGKTSTSVAKTPLVVGEEDPLGLDDESPQLRRTAAPARVCLCSEDDDASRTPSYYCDQPHLLAGSEDEYSCERNMVESAVPLHAPLPPARGHHCYKELGGMYHTPDVPTERKNLDSVNDSAGPSSPMSVAEYDDDNGNIDHHPQRQQMPQNDSFGHYPPRREKSPVQVWASVQLSSKDAVEDSGELPSLSLCTSPYSSYVAEDEEQPFDVIDSPRALSPYSNSFDITVTDAEETPFDEGSGFVDCDGDQENPFDECRPISPLSHPANRHKSRPTATDAGSGAAKSVLHNRQSSAVSDLAYSLPDNDLIIDFDPQLIGRKNASLKDGRHNVTLSEDEDPTFLESLTYTKSDGRLTPETYNGKHLLSRSCTTSSSGIRVHDEDEPSI